MHRVLGRTDDMLIIRGVNVFPSQIEEVILKVEGVEPHYQLIVERRDQLDELEVQVEMNEKMFSDEIKGLERMETQDRGGPVRRPEHPHPGEARGAQEHRAQRGQGQADHRQASRIAPGRNTMSVKQISVFLENKKGRLAEVTQTLSGRGDQHPRALPGGHGGLRRAAHHREQPRRMPGRAEGERHSSPR